MTETSTTPHFLEKEFFGKVLAKSMETSIKIVQVDIIKTTPCGHYCSDIYRVKVQYKVGEESEVKELPILIKDLYESVAGVSNEYYLYANVLPEINKTLASVGIPPVSPKVYWSEKAKNEVHFFEDLSTRNYELRSRLGGYEENDAKLLLKRMGEYHAASLIFMNKHADTVATGIQKYFYVNNLGLRQMCDAQSHANIEHVVKKIETWPGFEKIAAKMRKNIGPIFQERLLNALDLEECKIKLVLHGDLWISNILLLGSPQDPKDAIFLDYQNSCICTPAIDIHNLLMTSVVWPVFHEKRDMLIDTYYEAFSGTLKLCKFDEKLIPSRELLNQELKRTEYYNYYLLAFPFAQTMLSEELTNGLNINSFGNADILIRNREDIFNNQRVLDTYKAVLPRLDALGVLD